MADSSSTSSSERPVAKEAGRAEHRRAHAFPWALLIAFGLVLVVELLVRRVDERTLIFTRGDSDQARAVRDEISLNEGVDVAFVGSSMTYQGINVADLESKLKSEAGREVRVRNYAIRGGRMDLFAATVRHLLRQETKPRLIVVGVSIRDLRDYDLDLERASIFWNASDFAHVVRERGTSPTKYLPTVIRNEIEPRLWLLKHRHTISTKLKQEVIDIATEPMPARGESPSQHLSARRNTTLTMNEFKSTSNKRRMVQAYRIDLPPEPPAMFVACVDEVLADCRAAGVKLIFLDMPISEPMQGLLINADKKRKSDRIEPLYRATMAARCAAANVPFLTAADLSLTWNLEDFYDSQHLNYAGAMKLDAAIAPVLARELK